MRISRLFVVALCSIASGLYAGDPVGTAFTYQGALLSAGDPRTTPVDLRFSLFNAHTGGARLGPVIDLPAQSVSDSGVFSVELDFGDGAIGAEQRWLEIEVKDPANAVYTVLTPRQPITPAPLAAVSLKPWSINGPSISYSGGLVGIGTDAPRASLHLTNRALNDTPEVLLGDDFIIEDFDAIISLLSNELGVAGSGIVLKEITADGELTNQWAMYRGTSGAGSPLNFTLGTDPNYTINPKIFRFAPDGTITTPSRTRSVLFYAPTANVLGNMKIAIALTGSGPIYSLQTVNTSGNGIAVFPIDLPAGTVITELSAGVSDFNPTGSAGVAILSHEFGSREALEPAFVQTTPAFNLGHEVISTVLSPPLVLQPNTSYVLEARIRGSFNSNVEVIDARITYTTDQIE